MQRVRNAQYTRPSYLGHLARLAPRTAVLRARQPPDLVARGARGWWAARVSIDERPGRLGPRPAQHPARSTPDTRGNQPVSWVILRNLAWTFVNLHAIEPTRPRAATSRPWPENSTPSSRRSYGDNVASMAWGARNLISTRRRTASAPPAAGSTQACPPAARSSAAATCPTWPACGASRAARRRVAAGTPTAAARPASR